MDKIAKRLMEEGFTQDQLDEIGKGLESKIDISIYAKKEFLSIQMRQIRFGIEQGLAVEKYASLEYDWFQMEEIRKGLLGGIEVEYRNLESGEHIRRVKGYTRILAEKLMECYPEYGLTKEKIDVIVSASALHDIGKIAIPDSILLKPGKLTEEEFEYMKSHTTRGCEILKNMLLFRTCGCICASCTFALADIVQLAHMQTLVVTSQ